ncbi:hypothetical protein [Bacillus seohaeanensis]|uniref:Fur-regulated basic protein FbpA n=1 Tax=Bacillus seohaeanensis TaxID=284580 RepID=A0ABW5RS47_9BACI
MLQKINSLDTEKRKRLDQLVKKIGMYLKRCLLPLEIHHLFHNELAAGARQRKAKAARSAREENRDVS